MATQARARARLAHSRLRRRGLAPSSMRHVRHGDDRMSAQPYDEPLDLDVQPACDLATIRPPEKGRPASEPNVTIREHGHRHPTLPGKATDIVHVDGRVTTVQCAACLRTATGRTPWWVIVANQWNHAPGDGESRTPTPYKRCPDCRTAGRHPHTLTEWADKKEATT